VKLTNDSDLLNNTLICDRDDYEMIKQEIAQNPKLFKDDAVRLQSVEENRKTFAITFKGKGVHFGEEGPLFGKNAVWWNCRRTVDGLSCE
jgi:hypothetical protein